MAKTNDNLTVYGIHPVKEFLENDFLPAGRLFIREGSIKGLRHLVDLANGKSVPVKILSNPVFDRQDKTRNSQGVFMVTAPFEYSDLDELQINSNTMLLALDLVKDPQNLGSLLRSSAFFGVAGVILPKDRSVQVTPSAIRTSAGGIAHVPVFRVTNLARTLRNLKDRGVWVVGADSNEGVATGEFGPSYPMVVVLGAENNGLRQNIKKTCDFLVRIPTQTGFDSLNVAVAGAILMYALKPSAS